MTAAGRPILVAEDEESDAFMLRLACQKAGLTRPLVVVGDGREAVDYLSGSGRYADRSVHPLPALVVLDLKMPRMTGFDVLGWLAEQPTFKTLPAVVLSSSSDESDIKKARALGAREYFIKPHRLEDLVDIARRMELQSFRVGEPRSCATGDEFPTDSAFA
jgi:CheY-like chemotaxis protein